MMPQPKWIIEEDKFILSKCNYHKELANDISEVKGGGLFQYNHEENTFTLFGESYDFGAVTLEEIKACFKAGNVYRDRLRVKKFDLDKIKFIFTDIYGDLHKLN